MFSARKWKWWILLSSEYEGKVLRRSWLSICSLWQASFLKQCSSSRRNALMIRHLHIFNSRKWVNLCTSLYDQSTLWIDGRAISFIYVKITIVITSTSKSWVSLWKFSSCILNYDQSLNIPGIVNAKRFWTNTNERCEHYSL